MFPQWFDHGMLGSRSLDTDVRSGTNPIAGSAHNTDTLAGRTFAGSQNCWLLVVFLPQRFDHLTLAPEVSNPAVWCLVSQKAIMSVEALSEWRSICWILRSRLSCLPWGVGSLKIPNIIVNCREVWTVYCLVCLRPKQLRAWTFSSPLSTWQAWFSQTGSFLSQIIRWFTATDQDVQVHAHRQFPVMTRQNARSWHFGDPDHEWYLHTQLTVGSSFIKAFIWFTRKKKWQKIDSWWLLQLHKIGRRHTNSD